MSIHVTVNAEPVCIKRGGLMFSDLEQIRKYERGRRRRLRLEQVRQQSKNIASKILEQTKNIARREINNLENNENSKLKRMHEEKIMEIQRRYQEDMEDIGLAHESASVQPQSDVILKVKKLRDDIAANERGKDATRRLKETAKNNDEIVKQQERLRQVREVEDVRSSMVANLSKKLSKKPQAAASKTATQSTPPPSTFLTENTKVRRKNLPPKSRNAKKIRGKPSPKQSNKVTSGKSQGSTSSRKIDVEVHQQQSANNDNPIDVPCYSQCYRKSDSQSEIILPTQPTSSNTNETSSNYNPNDYKNELINSSNSSSKSSLISDDSSYFSDRPIAKAKSIVSDDLSLAKHHPSVVNSEVQFYDYKTREKHIYNHPNGVVERENLKSLPNANEMAQEIAQMDDDQSNKILKQRLIAKKRGNDALLRDKVRRDYRNLMNNLDSLSREERKLKSRQINNSTVCSHADKCHRNHSNRAKQQQMNLAYENSINNPVEINSEAIITIGSNCKLPVESDHGDAAWESPPFNDNSNDDDSDVKLSREEQILDMLKKVERQKRLLLEEFGATLPNDIFTATLKPLFVENSSDKPAPPPPASPSSPPSPEIKVINMSNCRGKKSDKSKKKVKKQTKNIPQTLSSTSEIAVQTQLQNEINKISIGNDKGTQVELPSDETVNKLDKPEHIEPVVTIITHSNSDMGSATDTSTHGIVINVGRGKVELTPRKLRIKRRSLPSSKSQSPIKPTGNLSNKSTSAPVSRAETPDGNLQNSTDESSTTLHAESIDNLELPTRTVNTMTNEFSRTTRVSISTDNSSSQSTSQSLHDTSTPQPYLLPKRRIKYKEVSDTSTSYASLPSMIQQTNDEMVNCITSILELVDSPANETINRLKVNVSPVSTPETPSPRTMRIPSNIPNVDRITRILTFDDRIQRNKQKNGIEKSEIVNQRRVIRKIPIYQETKREICSCHSSKCNDSDRQSHIDSHKVEADDTNEFDGLTNDEEKKNSCVEKIEYLASLIHKLRDENKGIEFSMLAPSDDTSLMQLPSPKLSPGMQSLQNLVSKIERIHNELTATFAESEDKLITRNIQTRQIISSPTSEINHVKNKPTITSNERVYFSLKKVQRPTDEPQSSTSNEINRLSDSNIVEALSKEILEQSQSVDRVRIDKETSATVAPGVNQIQSENKGIKSVGYSQVLADIPRIPNKLPITSNENDESRNEVKFGRLKLSTIDELDSTDTVNQSHISKNQSPTKHQQTPNKPDFNSRKISRNVEHSLTDEKYSTSVEIIQSNSREKNDKDRGPLSLMKDNQVQCDDNNIGEILSIEKSVRSPDSLLTNYSTRLNAASELIKRINLNNEIKCDKLTSSSSSTPSGLSDISRILTSPSSDTMTSPVEPIESQLKKLGLSSLIPTAMKTRRASALSSSSNSDTTLTINKRTKSSMKKFNDGNSLAFLDFSDVSSISIREASKSTEKNVLMKGRTSTPNILNYNYTSEKSISTTANTTSGRSLHDYSDSLTSKALAIH